MEEMYCKFCGIDFKDKQSCIAHIQRSHRLSSGKASDLTCNYCKVSYSNKYNLKRHKLTCKKNPINCENIKQKTKRTKEELKSTRCCRWCTKTFTRNLNLKLHEEKCGAQKYNISDDVRDKSLLITPDNRRESELNTTCDFCKQTFANRTRCIQHMLHCVQGGLRNINDTHKYRCLSCCQQFETLKSKQDHYKSCNGSGIDVRNPSIKFNIMKHKSFKESSFVYFILPRDPEVNYLTNQSLWKMVLHTQPIIEYYQNNRDKYPALKINVVLVSDFLSSSIIDSDSTGANKSDSQIFLQS